MMINKTLISVFVISIGLVFANIMLLFPRDGGIFLIAIGAAWFLYQLWRNSTFLLSKGFVPFLILISYLIWYSKYSKPIPGTYILIHEMLVLFLFSFLAYTSMHASGDRVPWENAIIILAIIVSLWGITEIGSWYFRYFRTVDDLQILLPPQVAYRLTGDPFMHPNILAGFLNFVWPIALIRLLYSSSKTRKLIWGCILTVIAIAFIYTNSRGALLGMVAEGLLFFWGFVFLQKKYFNQRGATFSIGKKGFAIFLPSALGLLTLVLIILWRSIFTRQFVSTLRNLSGRSTIWKFSWIAFQEKPVLGQGIVSFPIDYTRLANLPPGDFAPTAHNLWLQIGADYGLLGLTFVFVIIVLFGYSGIKRIWQDASTSLKLPFSLAYLAGFVGFLVQNLVDFTLVTPFYAIIFILIMTLAVRYALGWGTWALNRKGYGILGLIVLGCVFFYQLVLGMQLPSFVNSLMNAESTCQYSKQHPDNAIYKFECSQEIAQQMARDFQNDPDVDLWWNHAVAIQQAGYDTNPYWATQGINLAVLYWGKGDRTVALDYMRHTATAFPMYDAAWLNLGWMEEHTGNYVAAFNAYTRTLRINPLINRSVAAQDSKLFAAAADDLKTWGESEHLWGFWYDDTRHDRAKYDTDYWRGVIALSVGDPQIAIQEFTISLKNGNLNPSIYVLLSYAYDLNGQSEFAFKVAQDSALLHENRIRTLESPVDISIVASILHKNGADEQAYDLFLNAFTKSVTKIVYARYYALVYGRQILLSDISPWTIRTDLILVDTQDDWTWFAEEADRRGDTELAEAVTFWLNQLPGIANLEK